MYPLVVLSEWNGSVKVLYGEMEGSDSLAYGGAPLRKRLLYGKVALGWELVRSCFGNG